MNNWIVFYYIDQNENCEITDFLNSLKEKQCAKVLAWIDKLEEKGPELPRPFADLLEDGIHELRIKIAGSQERVLYFFVFRNYIILTHHFTKNEQTVSKSQINKAKKIRNDFNLRFKTLEQFEKYLNELGD